VSTLLISRPDRVGDVIIATSCLEPIRRQIPEARLVFLARETMRPLLEGHPLLEGFIGLPSAGQGSFSSRWRSLAGQLRAWKADALVHLHPDRLCQLAGRSANIPRRIGYRHSFLDRLTLTASSPDHRPAGLKHEGECNFDLLAPLGIAPPASADELRPCVHLSERWQGSLGDKLAAAGWADSWPPPTVPAHGDSIGNGGYMVLNPTAHSPTLRWPAESFAQLAREAAGRLGKIVLVAERADDPSILEIRRLLGAGFPGLIDLAGGCNLAELGWLLRHARVLVSRNTGTAHLAAAVGCPTAEIFGRLEGVYGPARWRALGGLTAIVAAEPGERRRGESKQAYWRRSYASIPIADVLDAALRLGGGDH
jgi:ADP-heptose:LPS heptosyltransferase